MSVGLEGRLGVILLGKHREVLVRRTLGLGVA